MSELVHLGVSGPVATITLDSNHNRNALSRQLVSELGDHIRTADADPTVRAIVLRSAGRVFCSGADLSEAASGSMTEGAERLMQLQRSILTAAKPVVVVLAGPVRAGGLGIVGAADIVLAADSVTFALTEVRLGVAPAVISATLLPRLTDRAASELFLTARTFDAAEAANIGLVTRVVPEEELIIALNRLLSDLGEGHPQGLQETKALLNVDVIRRIDERGEHLARLSTRLFNSDGAREAMKAFLNRSKS